MGSWMLPISGSRGEARLRRRRIQKAAATIVCVGLVAGPLERPFAGLPAGSSGGSANGSPDGPQGAPHGSDRPSFRGPSSLAGFPPPRLRPADLRRAGRSADAWRWLGQSAMRGMTIGPIENAYHPGRGYGSPRFSAALERAKSVGATWVALTPFGRVADLTGRGVDPTFEVPHAENVRAIATSIAQAHGAGLRVMLVPHLWVESGDWRAKIDPPSDAAWAAWARSYGKFVLGWARVAEEAKADLFSIGVELRSWATGTEARRLAEIALNVRSVYSGLLVYSANWDDADDVVLWSSVDLIGINAFYPLASMTNAPAEDLGRGAERVRASVEELAARWEKPVLFTEFGYTARADCALRPWEWPDDMDHPQVDEADQEGAYRALLESMTRTRGLVGAFVWRMFADPDDLSQEADWGFSPLGKRAERTLRSSFAARWWSDPK